MWLDYSIVSYYAAVRHKGGLTMTEQNSSPQNGGLIGIGMANDLWTRESLTSAWVQIPDSGSVLGIAVKSERYESARTTSTFISSTTLTIAATMSIVLITPTGWFSSSITNRWWMCAPTRKPLVQHLARRGSCGRWRSRPRSTGSDPPRRPQSPPRQAESRLEGDHLPA